MTSARLLRLAALSVLLSGCNVFSGDDRSGELADRRRAWQALHISDYAYDFERLCFCGGPAGRTLRVVVRANQIVSVTDVQTGQPPEMMPSGWAMTIDSLFGELQVVASRDPDKMDLTFDKQFHFPARASIDRVKNAIDDELVLNASNFVAAR
jgi:hypothetical protein